MTERDEHPSSGPLEYYVPPPDPQGGQDESFPLGCAISFFSLVVVVAGTLITRNLVGLSFGAVAALFVTTAVGVRTRRPLAFFAGTSILWMLIAGCLMAFRLF